MWRARHLGEPAIQIDTQRRADPLSPCSLGLVRLAETSSSTVSWLRDRMEHGGLLMPQLGVDAAFVVFGGGLPLGVGAGLAPSSPKAPTTSFTWRWSASLQKPSGTPPYRFVEGSVAAC